MARLEHSARSGAFGPSASRAAYGGTSSSGCPQYLCEQGRELVPRRYRPCGVLRALRVRLAPIRDWHEPCPRRALDVVLKRISNEPHVPRILAEALHRALEEAYMRLAQYLLARGHDKLEGAQPVGSELTTDDVASEHRVAEHRAPEAMCME